MSETQTRTVTTSEVERMRLAVGACRSTAGPALGAGW